MMKTNKYFWNISTFLLIGLLFLSILTACQPEAPDTTTVLQQPKLVITPPDMDPVEQKITEAFKNAIAGREDVISFLVYNVNIDNIQINSKKNKALIWISLSDPTTGDVISAEAGLAIAQKIKAKKDENPWKITLQADENWQEVLNSLPNKLIDDETKEQFSNKLQAIPHAAKVYSGYRLPWATGESKYLSGSIGHVYLYKSCPTTCLYAFDFYDGTMWDILAAKGGKVKYAVWEYPNGNTKHANYIVLEDTSTNPTTYQVYMHLAQDSIPVALRTVGAKVVQGQKIGVVDDTGYSTGHHLHFHVHTNSSSYWGTSVDITFDDVKVNGGRPRTCTEAGLYPSLGSECQKKDLYTSKNNDYKKPTGKITLPKADATITKQTVVIKGNATDDSGIQSLQVLINYDGTWNTAADIPVTEIGKKGAFSTTLDLCSLNIPDGEFSIKLSITDKANKSADESAGLRTLTKQYTCPLPEPKCTIASNQISVFEKAEYQGECILLDIGEYDLLNQPITLIDTVGSIDVGSDVVSEFITADGDYPFISSVTNSDGIGFDFSDIQSIAVESRPPAPQSQTLYINDQTNDDLLSSDTPIIISWDVLDASFEYRATLLQDSKQLLQQDWVKTDKWEISGLEPGTYSVTLEIHNLVGDAVSATDFIVQKLDLPPVTSLNELPDLVDSSSVTLSWTIVDGLDDLNFVEIRYKENEKDWQSLGTFPAQITSTVFSGKSGSTYQFQLRGVDVAGNEEEFHSGAASTVTLQAVCTPDDYDLTADGDNSFLFASTLELNNIQTHNVCNAGDHDYYSFTTEEGANYRITVSPSTSSGSFTVQLFDQTQTETIASTTSSKNGDIASMVWTAPDTSTYYIDVSATDAEVSGEQTAYEIELIKLVQLSSPGIVIPSVLVPLLLSLLALSKRLLRKFGKVQ